MSLTHDNVRSEEESTHIDFVGLGSDEIRDNRVDGGQDKGGDSRECHDIE